MLPFTSVWKFLEVTVYQASYLNKCPIWPPILLYYAFKTTTPFVDALVNERLRQLLPSTPLTIACLRRCLECVLHAAR